MIFGFFFFGTEGSSKKSCSSYIDRPVNVAVTEVVNRSSRSLIVFVDSSCAVTSFCAKAKSINELLKMINTKNIQRILGIVKADISQITMRNI